MSKEKEDTALIELDNRLKALEARIKKLENWKLVHTSMGEEEETANQKYFITEICSCPLMPANYMTNWRPVIRSVNKRQILHASF